MDIKVIEKKKNRIKFEIQGHSHALCNALSSELWNDKDVTVAGYNLEHPLIHEPTMIVETDKTDPKKALNKAIDRLSKKNKDFISQIKKIIK